MKHKLTLLKHYFTTKYSHRWKSRQSLLDWQEQLVLRHIRFTRKHSPFYRDLWAHLPDEEWRSFPLINKQIMMQHFETFNTVGISKERAFSTAKQAEKSRDFKPMIGNISVGLSSGTSGNRGIFLVSAKERAAWAGTVLAKVLPKNLFSNEKIAFFLRANNQLYESVGSGRLQFRFFDLIKPIEQHIFNLNEYQPSLLIAPPTMLGMLAEAVKHDKLQIRPQKIISVAEVLEKHEQNRIEAIFQQPLHQIYQCTEGFLAYTCQHNRLHLNEDLILIEPQYVDQENKKFIPIITDFTRTTQPIIRYRLDDLLSFHDQSCPCGSVFRVLEAVHGRADDVFYFPAKEANRENVAVFPDFITRAIIRAAEHIIDYRVVQLELDQVEISLKIDSASVLGEKAIIQAINENFQQLCDDLNCLFPRLRFTNEHLKNEDERGEWKKLRRVERRCLIK